VLTHPPASHDLVLPLLLCHTTASPEYYFALSGPITLGNVTTTLLSTFSEALLALLAAQQLPAQLGADLQPWLLEASDGAGSSLPGVVVIGLQFTGSSGIVDPSLPALDALLGGDNTTTTVALARGLFERTVAAGDGSFYSQAWGLAHAAFTYVPNASGDVVITTNLGTSIPIGECALERGGGEQWRFWWKQQGRHPQRSECLTHHLYARRCPGRLSMPVHADGCQLVPSYCGTNGAGSCALSVCACNSGFGGYRCTQVTGAVRCGGLCDAHRLQRWLGVLVSSLPARPRPADRLSVAPACCLPAG
jgi:hypothetical protein